ncbi:UDP-N-acetylmuramate--L-alanine ligase [Trichinella spiralis]|uniref:UDP-N-acetylmuramate--L-alanine ligase n=1 Tax=Trichinella spiralis TaxID=6334 RepID=A0ABR3L022_TRISP
MSNQFDLKQRHRQSADYWRCYVNECVAKVVFARSIDDISAALDDRLRLTFAYSYTVREWEKLNGLQSGEHIIDQFGHDRLTASVAGQNLVASLWPTNFSIIHRPARWNQLFIRNGTSEISPTTA